MRAFALLGLLLIVLSGCSDGGDPEGGGSTTTSSSTASTASTSGTSTSTGSATTTSTGAVSTPNQAPDANLTADASNGTSPLTVNFTLAASDPDGDVLDWTFDADGDGTLDATGTSADLPKTVPFTYNATGEFRAALNVTDGTDNRTAIHLVVVAEGGGEVEMVDYGEYVYDPATGLCHAKDYTEEAPGVYVSGLGGGTWVILEDNDVDGLQYENNHPLRDVPNSGAQLPVDPVCVGGDQTTF